MNSIACDYVIRQKLGGTSMTYFYVKQFATPEPGILKRHRAALVPRLLELGYTAWDMAPFAADLGWHGPPFHWDTDRRTHIRSEIDALMFRLYGIDSSDVGYILDTFEVLQKKDLRRWGEYRTKRLTLERFDAMEQADHDGHPYRTALDPPPADPSVAHDRATTPEWYPMAELA